MKSPFPLPLAFTSWAFNKQPDGTPVDKDAVHNMVKAARQMGALSVAVQTTEGVTAADIHALRGYGLFVAGWAVCTSDTAAQTQRLDLQGFMPQIEGDGQYDAAVQTLRTLKGLLPVSVVSDYGGLGTKERCDVLRGYGATTLFVEAYADSGASHADLPHYVVELSAPYGYTADTAIPCMGTYRNEHPTAYAGVEAYAGPAFSVYLLEPMTGQQLDAWAALAHQAPPPTPNPTPPPSNGGTVTNPPPTGAEARTATHTAARFWETRVTSPDPLSRATNSRRIADPSNTDERWATIRDDISQLLDQAGVAK